MTEPADPARRLALALFACDVTGLTPDMLRVALAQTCLELVPSPDGWTQPMVTVASLVEAAAGHAEDHEWAAADALLRHAAATANGPRLGTYRAILSAMEMLAAAGRTEDLERFAVVASEAQAKLYDELVRGPDAPAATGREEF